MPRLNIKTMEVPAFWPELGHFNLNQYYYVKSLVEGRKIECALETGFHTGRSALSILNNCPDLKTMISIDIIFVEERRKLLEEKFSKLALTDDFFQTNYPEGIDYCLLDGDHSYNGCLSDLELVLPHMKGGGLIVIDDYESGPPDGCPIPEVTNACDDFYKHNSEKLSREKWYKEGKGFCIFTVK